MPCGRFGGGMCPFCPPLGPALKRRKFLTLIIPRDNNTHVRLAQNIDIFALPKGSDITCYQSENTLPVNLLVGHGNF